MNMLGNLDEIANIIIRPSRYTYKMTDLGNKTFKINDQAVFREDFEVKNPRNLKIKVSIYSTQQLREASQILIYLHCNSGCRVQGLAYLKLAIQNNFAYVVFDFTGSGMSEGKYVSLGFYQTQDLECVYNYIKTRINDNAKFVLWGRSMGAVTALNFLLQKQRQIFMAVFDSPFRSLKQLFIQIGRQKTSFPDFILEMAYNYLKPIIQQKAQFDIEQVGLQLQNNLITVPGIFIASKQDCLVPFQQIDQIFNMYRGDKQMLFIEQGHNEARNMKVINSIFKSIQKQMLTSDSNAKKRLQKQNEKKIFASGLDKKQLSRKKLELTIKSLSHRQLLTTTIGKILKQDEPQHVKKQISLKQNPIPSKFSSQTRVCQLPKPAQQHISTPTPNLQKKPISCLLLPHKKSLKVLSIQEEENRFSFQESDKKLLAHNKSESKLKVKRKPFQIKNFFGNQNALPKVKDFIRIQEEKTAQTKNNSISKTQSLKENNFDSKSIRHHATTKQPLKNLSAVYSSKQNVSTQSPQKFTPTEDVQKRPKLQFGQSSHKKPKDKQEPHSDIKDQSQKMNFHEDFVKEKQFLKRCQSLQKIFKVQEINLPTTIQKILEPNPTHTYRQIKCTERVLQKIIEKQQRKLLVLNLQSTQAHKKQKQNIEQEPKQRKTLQNVLNKKPPFVQLRGIKNFRNSLESKYKTEIRK